MKKKKKKMKMKMKTNQEEKDERAKKDLGVVWARVRVGWSRSRAVALSFVFCKS